MATATGPYDLIKQAQITLLGTQTVDEYLNYIGTFAGNTVQFYSNPLIVAYLAELNGFFGVMSEQLQTDPAGFIAFMAEPSTLSTITAITVDGYTAFQNYAQEVNASS